MRKILLVLIVVVLFGCGGGTRAQQTKNIEAFAKVYGLLRWFYPADEVQQVDWNQLAVYGVSQISECRTAEELGAKLRSIFQPFTNGVIISNAPEYDMALITPADTTGMKLVTWQHYGVDLGIWSNIYASKRTNRPVNPLTWQYKMENGWWTISAENMLFEEHSNFGDIFSLKLADNLYVHVPLALYGTKGQTFPIGNTVTKYDTQPSDKTLMLADIVVAWNVIKYFSPYLADMGVDWDDEFSTALKRALEYDSYNSRPLKLMMAQLCDAHVYVNTPYDTPTETRNYIPMYIRKVEGKLVVIYSFNSQLQRGDIIERINGENTAESFRYFEDMVSGNEHHKALMAVAPWLRSFEGDAKLKIKRGSETLNLTVPLMPRSEFSEYIIAVMGQNPSRWLDENTLYLNLSNTGLKDIHGLLATCNRNQRIIVDIREGATFLLDDILELLFDKSQLIPRRRGISNIPHIVYPQTPIIADTLLDIMPPAPDKKIIFLVGVTNISNHEEVLDYVKYAGLGYLVGTNTGGCNGRINVISLPSGGDVRFTGTKVLSNLGRSHYYYGVGIAPDLYVEESIEDIIAGRDAALEAAVKLNEF